MLGVTQAVRQAHAKADLAVWRPHSCAKVAAPTVLNQCFSTLTKKLLEAVPAQSLSWSPPLPCPGE